MFFLVFQSQLLILVQTMFKTLVQKTSSARYLERLKLQNVGTFVSVNFGMKSPPSFQLLTNQYKV